MVLGERLRSEREREFVSKVLERIMKCNLDMERMYGEYFEVR